MNRTSSRLAGHTICYVSVGGFGGVWRTVKQAHSVADAGARVVFVGYDCFLPAGIAESGHEVVKVPHPEAPTIPKPIDPPRPPDPPTEPVPPLPAEWPSSPSRFRLVRAVTNRTVNYWAYKRSERRYQQELSEYRVARAQYEDRILQHHEGTSREMLAYAVAEREYLEAVRRADSEYYKADAEHKERALHYYAATSNPGLIAAVIASQADVVQAVDLPALGCAQVAAEALDARLIYAAHELWAGFLNNPDSPADPVAAAGLLELEETAIQSADLITVTSDQMGKRLTEMYGASAPLTLLNAPPQRVETPRPASTPLRLVYHGGLSNDRNIDGLVRAMEHLGGRATLDIHGFDRTLHASTLQDLADELGLGDSIRLHGPFEYGDVVEMLRGYDLGVMSAIVVEENFDVTLPNKVFDCMCAGVAIAMYDSSAIRALLAQVPFGVTIDPSTPESIASTLNALSADHDRVTRMKQVAVASSSRYWWPEQGRKLVEALEGMLT